MPVNFGDAPGGWLIAHMNADHELAIFFYDSATEAERAKDEAQRRKRTTAQLVSRTCAAITARTCFHERRLVAVGWFAG
jgi:hypothetical protein